MEVSWCRLLSLSAALGSVVLGEPWELGLIPVPCGTKGLTVPGLEVL